MPAHQIDYRIHGASLQALEVSLDPGEAVIAEAGSMIFMQEDIRFDTRLGDGSESGMLGKLWGVGKRLLTGESLFMTHFSNDGEVPRSVGFAAPYPGSIEPVHLPEVGGALICQKDSFLAAAHGTSVGITFSKRIGAGLFGGEGFILQKLEGDGMAFIHAGGTLIRRELNNETLRLDTGCLVAFSAGLDYSIALSGGLKSLLFGGEGLLLATLKGTGTVWIQSLPFARLADRMAVAMAGRGPQGETRAGGD